MVKRLHSPWPVALEPPRRSCQGRSITHCVGGITRNGPQGVLRVCRRLKSPTRLPKPSSLTTLAKVLMGAEETTSGSWHCRENCCCTGLGRNVSSDSKKGRRSRTVRLRSLKLNRRRLPRRGCSYIYLLRAMAQDRVKAHQGHPGRHGHGAVDWCCADRAVVSQGQALPTVVADHRSGSGPFLHSRWNPFQRLGR
jgi:hypothetical protein